MKMPKTLLLAIVFMLTVIINSILIYGFYINYEFHKSQQSILADLDKIDIAAGEGKNIQPPLVTSSDSIDSEVKLVDGRSANLKRYLRSINSPLFEYTDVLIEEADEKGYDYKLLVAIALQESTGCKKIPPDSYNCWGWGIYGDKITRFSSYEEGIRIVSDGIKRNYIDKGLVTTEDIMRKYTPGSNGSWAWAVRFFFQRIESF